MLIATYVLACLALALGLYPLGLALRFRRYVLRELAQPAPRDYQPKVAMILPCKGVDPGFEENIQALIAQDYPDYEVLFVTATDDDPAYPVLDRFAASNANCKLLVAGIAPGRGQKLNNQLKGLEAASPDAEVFVFVDSDVRPAPDFLAHLAAPLADPRVGAATGFRWYLPESKPNLPTMLRSTWNGGGLPFLLDAAHNYAYGGAMAVRREVFESAGIRQRWETALSDDMTLTEQVKAEGEFRSWAEALDAAGLLVAPMERRNQADPDGSRDPDAFDHVLVHKSAFKRVGPERLRIKFAPQCLTVTEEDSTLSEVLEWTNRQTIVAKVYNKQLWWSIAIAHGFTNAMLLLGIVLVAVGAACHRALVFPGCLMLGLIPLMSLNALVLMPCVEAMMPAHAAKLRRLKWWYFVLPPLASLLSFVNTLYSLTTNRITWRGVTYELRSPRETSVIGASACEEPHATP